MVRGDMGISIRRMGNTALFKLLIAPTLTKWMRRNARVLAFVLGTIVVVMWTVIRFVNNGVNYDVVGQIGVAAQWAQGYHGEVQFASANYILKLPLYFLVNSMHFLSPSQRLLVIVIMCNIATYIVIGLLFEKVIRLYNKKIPTLFYVILCWFAVVFGSIYWADYANSRNLETAGAVLFVYLSLKVLKSNKNEFVIWLFLSATLLFFADPLQFFVCGIGVCLYGIGHAVFRRSKQNSITALLLALSVFAGYVGSHILVLMSHKLLGVSLLKVPSQRPTTTIETLTNTVQGSASGIMRIFGADFYTHPFNLNTTREMLSFCVLAGLVIYCIRSSKKIKDYTAPLLLSCIISMNIIVYAVSGQALLQDTSRYLVMVPILFLLLVAVMASNVTAKIILRPTRILLVATGITGVLIIGAFAKTIYSPSPPAPWSATIITYLTSHRYKYAVSSREIGVTGTYFADGATTIMPMACDPNHGIYMTDLFFDKASFKKIALFKGDVPVIVPPGGIKYLVNCTELDIVKQFGIPKSEELLDGVGTVLVYDAGTLLKIQ